MLEPVDRVFLCTYGFTPMWDLFTIKTLVSCGFDLRFFLGWFGVTLMWDLFCIKTLVPCGICYILLLLYEICYILSVAITSNAYTNFLLL